MTKNISATIIQVCKDLRIPYKSNNLHCLKYHNDAVRLLEIYKQIESLTSELNKILHRHNIGNKIQAKWKYDLKELHKIDHDLIRFAIKIKKEKC